MLVQQIGQCHPSRRLRFGILLFVETRVLRYAALALISFSASLPSAIHLGAQAKPQTSQPAVSSAASSPSASPAQAPSSNLPATQTASQQIPPPPAQHEGLNVVVLDPAHGGTDPGARGTEGIRESDLVVQFAAETKVTLEARGFHVVLTRDSNDNPSFDDRSAISNAQRGAVFISIHIASTGLPGTVRVYVVPEIPMPSDNITGLIPWDRAQGPFVHLSHKLGDLVQVELAKRFKGSPTEAQVAPVRQLRTTAAPAIAVEISSVSVGDRVTLERMIPGVAESIARGVAAFRPSYVVPAIGGATGGSQP